MRYILDLQGYWIQRKFIVKELILFCTDLNIIRKYHFKPIVTFSLLSEKNQNVVTYCEKLNNRLCWNSGNLDYDKLAEVICQINTGDTVSVLYCSSVSSVKYFFGHRVSVREVSEIERNMWISEVSGLNSISLPLELEQHAALCGEKSRFSETTP